MRISDSAIAEILHEKSDWIEKKASEALQQKNIHEDMVDKGHVMFLGKKYELEVVPSDGANKIELDDDILRIYGSEDEQHDLLMSWYRQQAKKIITPLAKMYAEMLGEDFSTITIKNMKSRWGSCSSKNRLNFSLALILAPYDVVKYVVIHEVCHLRYPHHKRTFWEAVEKFEPEYKTKRKWLRDNGWILRL